MKYLYFLFCLLGCLGCTYYGSINLKKHKFAEQPQKIIWLHFSGLDEEHISLLKFFHKNTSLRTSFENASCFGKVWRYNLYQLRPNYYSSFLSQALGTQNITQTCKDYNLKPMWSYLSDYGYDAGILEKVENSQQSLAHSKVCKKKDFLKETVLWEMQLKNGPYSFHAQEAANFTPGKIYYDKSCHKSGCYNSLLTNARAMFNGYFKGKQNFIFIVRDDTLSRYFSQKDLTKIKGQLLEVEKVFEYFLKLQKQYPDMLVLLTTSESLPIELPRRGEEWRDLVKGKDHLIYHKFSLLSPVWALGVRAENYCGLYEEAEILRRTLNNFTKERLHIFGIPVM